MQYIEPVFYFAKLGIFWLFFHFNVDNLLAIYQLRNAYQKLESELKSSQKRFAELVEQCNELKRGREESVNIQASFFYINVDIELNIIYKDVCCCFPCIWFSSFHQDERENALHELKALELKYNELKVDLLWYFAVHWAI